MFLLRLLLVGQALRTLPVDTKKGVSDHVKEIQRG